MNNSTPINFLATRFTLGEHRVDPGVNQIQGPDSVTQVEPKAMAVLCMLASRAGETVSREELMAAVWPGRVVVEETLTRAISQLRTAMFDNASRPAYIQTIPKKGYRLIAAVRAPDSAGITTGRTEPEDSFAKTGDRYVGPAESANAASVEASSLTPASTDRLSPQQSASKARVFTGIVAVSLLAVLVLYLVDGEFFDKPESSVTTPTPIPASDTVEVVTALPSVAVMPFRNLSTDSESEYFAEGIAEELLNALAAVPGLRVPSRRSSFAFKNKDAQLSTIASQLQVRHVLEGSVRRSGDTVRLLAQLIEVSTDTTVWSQQYDRELQDIFAVQEEIAQQVISTLRGTLLGATARPTRIARSANLDAYSLYLQGQYWWMNGTTTNWWYRARDAFEQAIELDPNFVDAHAGLAYIYARYNFYDEYMPAADAWPKAERAIERALALDATAVDAYFARAILSNTQGNYASARADLDLALALNPNSSTAYFLYSETWLADNQPQKAVAAAARALDLDPLSPWVNVNMAIVLFSLGQWDEAMEAVDRAVEIDPEYTWAYIWRGQIEHARGNLAMAIKAMHDSVRIDPASESSVSYLGLLYLELLDFERAGRWLEHAAALHGDNSSARFWNDFIALAYDQRDPDILIELAQDMSRLETTTYDLVPILHAALVRVGRTTGNLARFSRLHPELRKTSEPVVRIDNASSAVALVQVLREQGDEMEAEVLLDAALKTAGLFPALFRWRGHEAELLALAGRNEEALAALRTTFESGWRANWWMLERSPALATLRDEPEFADIIAAVKLAVVKQRERVVGMENGGEL